MTSLTAVLLLSLVTAASANANALGATTSATSVDQNHFPGATEAFACNFEPTGDDELYGLPTGWRRRHGPGYPRHVQIRLDDERAPRAGRSLRVDLNGGAASAFGPAVSITPGVDYVLEGYLKTSGLRGDRAWITLTFLDADRLKVSDVASEKLGGTTDWQKVTVGPVTPPAWATQFEVRICVAPQAGEDLHGAASFGGLWAGRLPRILLTARAIGSRKQTAGTATDSNTSTTIRGADATTFRVFARGTPIEAACIVSGLSVPQYEMHMELVDSAGRKLAARDEKCGSANVGQPSAGAASRAIWQLPDSEVGFYHLRAQVIPQSSTATHQGAVDKPSVELSLAIVDPELPSPDSEFGWSLDPADVRLGFVPMSDLLRQCGVHWLKFPFICTVKPEQTAANTDVKSTPANAPTTPSDTIEPLISFSDRLADAGIRLVGVLYPPVVTEPDQKSEKLLAVELFSADPSKWYPAIEPVLARLATEIRYWQVGDDRDPGWTDCRNLSATLGRVKTELDRIGQDVSLGMAWNLNAPLPIETSASSPSVKGKGAASKTMQKRPWRFLSLACDDAFTNDNLAARLDETASAGVGRWLAIDALPSSGATSGDRIEHLVDRMVTAKVHGAQAIIFAHPFDAERGLVNRDGSPTELFLPWRTVALALGGAAYAGDIDLADGSAIHCFANQGSYVGVVPGGAVEKESVCLGEHLRSRDLWGRATDLRLTKGDATEIEVKQLPTLVTGLDPAITEWQLHAAFAPRTLPSIPSAVVAVTLQLKNTFPRAASGRVHIAGPRNWYIAPQEAEFQIAPSGQWNLPLEMALPIDVVGGRQMFTLDFIIQADREYRFTMYRAIDVTLGDVALAGRASLAANGDLEVRQTLINQGKKNVSFRCNLLAPDRRRQSTEVVLQPAAKSEYIYRLPEGRDLLGKSLWLRAEEIDGSRVLNYRLDVPLSKERGTGSME